MSQGQGITREQSLGEVVSKTFDLYRRDFAKYLVLFAVVGAITGVLTTLVQRAFILPVPPANATPQQSLNWLPCFFFARIPLFVLTVFVAVVCSPLSVRG